MSLYQTVKSAITVRQVGEMYGMEPDRHGMVCCPFHSDNHPSMMLNESYYYCFACGANGDAIDLTAKLFDLNPRQAAEKLIIDFAFAKQCSPQWGLQVIERSCVSKMEGPRPDKLWLDPDKPPANAIALPPLQARQPGRTAGRTVRGSPPHDRDHRAPDGLRCIWNTPAEG